MWGTLDNINRPIFTRRIEMKRILYAECDYGKPEVDAVKRMFKRGWLSGGEETEAFQNEFAKWWGVKHAIAVTSGSAANFISLQSLNLPKGSEVITTACGFPTTVSPIYYQGLKPVYVDVSSANSLTIDLDEVEEAISKKTKAIMFAHTIGNMCDMDKLMEIVNKHDLKLIEDCCDAVGSKWSGKMAGTFGELATVSFYPSHHMTTAGHGGMILTDDDALARTCVSIRDWGRACYCKWNEKNPNGACGHRFDNPPFDHKFYYINLGLNLKMTELQAAFGREQIKRLDGFIKKRKENFKYLHKRLSKEVKLRMWLPRWGVKYQPPMKATSENYSYPDEVKKKQSNRKDLGNYNNNIADVSWFCFPLVCQNVNRMKMMKYLESKGIQTRTLFAGNIVRHPAYQELPHRTIGNLANSDTVLEDVFYIGVGPKLTKKELDYMADHIIKYVNK